MIVGESESHFEGFLKGWIVGIKTEARVVDGEVFGGVGLCFEGDFVAFENGDELVFSTGGSDFLAELAGASGELGARGGGFGDGGGQGDKGSFSGFQSIDFGAKKGELLGKILVGVVEFGILVTSGRTDRHPVRRLSGFERGDHGDDGRSHFSLAANGRTAKTQKGEYSMVG